ncbi:hypothetical protein HPO96_05565 [Kribbella sandramycini]|uniref:Alpha-L-rhamnosidase-like protein n=1 Tax=Kribbella sandramycini TaxID=60450 RepID=A0A7Y4NXB3_9ACTN|nr:hypothetical protein [Kribbella sandramycini]MBB6567692.1 hypothetical protein [Kribbella sandramycini]NOL39707.1 hypothetical protein [Kribbella sandramycini]
MSIAPLLWHHGEDPETIVREIEAIASSGIRAFVLEPRPHPDYLGPRYWSDVDVVLAAARERDLKVWFFDDGRFPSGWVSGRVSERPDLVKRHLAAHRLDVQGPRAGASVSAKHWLPDGITLHAVVAVRRDSVDTIDSDTLVDLTASVVDGVLYWDVPPGRWRIAVLTEGDRGLEDETAEYLNPIAEGAAAFQLAVVHEAHRERYGADFGGLISGFFQDEPRFGNGTGYEFQFGQPAEVRDGNPRDYVLPFSPALWARLVKQWGADARRRLPLLWWDGEPELTAQTRYTFMDEATRLYAEFQRELGQWCDDAGVQMIGHVVEDNGAHTRLGWGAGHYFRALNGQHMGGIDLVQHVQPGVIDGRRVGTFGRYDDEFYYWGLAKLASSAAHIDPRKAGRAMCEAFGAYGWHLGLRLMKQLTDHLAVRGVNFLVPHAFSPRTWDPDCPPHFYNGGLNPQWPHFPVWREYADRLCSELSGGTHHNDAMVLYHAEAEWAGEAMPFQRVLQVLMQAQRDAHVVPIDSLAAVKPELLIVPYAQRIPPELAETILALDIRTIFVDAVPQAFSGAAAAELMSRLTDHVDVVPLSDLAQLFTAAAWTPSEPQPWLRILRYDEKAFLVNESITETVDTWLTLPALEGHPVRTDLLASAEWTPELSGDRVRLRLGPSESCLLTWRPAALPDLPVRVARADLPQDGWTVSTRAYSDSKFRPVALTSLGPANTPERLAGFAGTIRYERLTDLTDVTAIDLGEAGETAELVVDGESLGVRIAHPYLFSVPHTHRRPVTLTVDVTTTLAPVAADNSYDAYVTLDPTGLIGPVTLFH